MRIAILWQAMSGYFSASLRALASLPGVDVCLAYQTARSEAPFDPIYFDWLNPQYSWDQEPDVSELDAMLASFRPDAVLVSSWHIKGYRAALKHLRQPATRVLCMDNQWLGTPKQWLGRLTWRQYIKPLFDIAFVPGDRQLAFANRLGFQRSHVLRGLYCADTRAFTPPADSVPFRERAFLFVGRLTQIKGVTDLLQAYRIYSKHRKQPWPLRIVGVGPLADIAKLCSGVEYLGFVQPTDLPRAMWTATSLILPSLFEPWGVVVHEAAIAGLIPICSERVGAAVHLVQDGYNGYVVPARNPADLALCMNRVSAKTELELETMRQASHLMSMQLTTDRWAHYVRQMLTEARFRFGTNQEEELS